MIDGCSEMKAMWKVMIPMASPGIITVTIFNFMNIWNEYFMALIFANGNDKIRTLSMGLQNMITSMKYTGDWAGLFAGVIIVLVPTLILYLLLSEKSWPASPAVRSRAERRPLHDGGRCGKIPQEGRAGSALPDIYVICADSRGRRRAFGAPQLSVCAFGKEMNDEKRLAIFGVIAALLMLAACSAAAPEYGTEQTQEQEQIVLHLFHYQGEAEEAYGHVIAAYEKAHPNVKIKSEFLNSENYNSTLDARIAVQDCPDLIGVHPGYAQALPLARAGYLADLSGQPCLENVRESDAETGSLAGSIYAAPTDLTYICTFTMRIFLRSMTSRCPPPGRSFLTYAGS